MNAPQNFHREPGGDRKDSRPVEIHPADLLTIAAMIVLTALAGCADLIAQLGDLM